MKKGILIAILFLSAIFNVFSINYGDVFTGTYEGLWDGEYEIYAEIEYIDGIDGYHIRFSIENDLEFSQYFFLEVKDYTYTTYADGTDWYLFLNDSKGKIFTVLLEDEDALLTLVKKE